MARENPKRGRRPARIETKRSAVAAIVGLQAAVLAIGWGLTFLQVRHATALSVEDLVLEENVRVVDWFAEQLVDGIEGPIEYGGAEWERLQSRVEGLEMPGEGFACIVDGDGQILCHPELRRDPSLRGASLGEMSLSPNDDTGSLTLNAAPRAETVAGRMHFFLDGTHYVATRWVPQIDARLLVHQPESGLVALSSRATAIVAFVAGFAALSVLAMTALSTLWVMHRYDCTLERINKGLEEEVERRTQENLRARDGLIMGLAKLADCRDSETGLHLERIAEYCELLAVKLAETHPEMDDPWIERLRLASSLHDIGKVGVSDEVLLKPGKLTDEEFRRMQRHTTIGADTLLAIRAELGEDELVDMSIQIALEHHEKWDGTGYPVGLEGEQIALPARIVALADVYDALTSRRVYKPAFSHQKAARIIVEGRGRHFDPMVVDAFLAIQDQFDRVRARLQPEHDAPALDRAA